MVDSLYYHKKAWFTEFKIVRNLCRDFEGIEFICT